MLGWGGIGLPDTFKPLLNLPHTAEILIEFLLIAVAENLVETTDIVVDEVQDALVVQFAAGAGFRQFLRVVAAEEAFEDQFRVHLLGIGSRFAAPGEIGGVGTTVTGIAVARLRSPFDPQFQRGEAGLISNG
jgi:hypothetical protein